MTVVSRILSIIVSLGLLMFIFNLVRKKKLKERYALIWLLCGIAILVFALSRNLLTWVTHAIGIQMPINMLFFIGILFITVVNIHFSVVISNLTEQNKKIAQTLTLIEAELKSGNI